MYNQKKQHRQEKRRLDLQYESANKRSSCQYQQNITNERSRPSPKMKNTNSMKTKYRIVDEQTSPPHWKLSNNVYVPLLIDSLDIKGGKNNTSKTTL